jgi:cytochrome b
MNTMSASRAERILVWDAAVRAFHWLLVLAFAGAWLTAESERWRLVHVTLGYTAGALVLFRIAWGFIGSFHARFANFVRGPGAVRDYLLSIVRGRPEHHTGHNPAGALAILALLGGVAALVATGWAGYAELAGEWVLELHEGIATALLALVGVHVFAVVASSLLHRENLVRAMVTGRKSGEPGEAIRSPRRLAASALVVAVLAFWTSQWLQPDVPNAGAQASNRHGGHHDGDDDDD